MTTQPENTPEDDLGLVEDFDMQALYDNDPELQEALAYAMSLPTKPFIRDNGERI